MFLMGLYAIFVVEVKKRCFFAAKIGVEFHIWTKYVYPFGKQQLADDAEYQSVSGGQGGAGPVAAAVDSGVGCCGCNHYRPVALLGILSGCMGEGAPSICGV